MASKARIGLAKEIAQGHLAQGHGTLARLGVEPKDDHPLRQVILFSDRFAEKLHVVERDVRLTEQGKQDARAKLVGETSEAFEKWYGPIRERHESAEKTYLNRLRAAVTEPPPTDLAERLAQELKKQEIRNRVGTFSAIERELVYRHPEASALVRTALEELPMVKKTDDGGIVIEPFVSRELADEVLLEAGRERLPDDARKLDVTREIAGAVEATVEAFRTELKRIAPSAAEGKPQVLA